MRKLVLILPRVRHRIDDDLHVQGLLSHHPLDGCHADPQVVRVEHVELLDVHELFHVVLRHLGGGKKIRLVNTKLPLVPTWATSRRRNRPSYCISVPPFTSARVLSVTCVIAISFMRALISKTPHYNWFYEGLDFENTSMMNSWSPDRQRSRMPRSTVAPRLSVLDMKQNCLFVTVAKP